ncbi:MAG: DotA/TraY family protein [Bdellovibrionales bacterium]|jgi:conjugal transfer/type IV secretion protein DotA/TraY
MLFNNDDDKAKDKKRSLLGLLFNPRFDRDIKPLGESMGMFVRMIAMVFAAHRLFPKDHPAMRDNSLRLTLREVIATAYSNLSFTKEGTPQILLFGAVIGTLVFAAIFIFALVMSLFTGSAHAAESMFTLSSENEKCDLAQKWIGYLFLGSDLNAGSGCASSYYAPNSQMIQQALLAAFSTYSSMILAVAGFLLMYHLASMIAETAHTGKPMGRANQVWAPIRLVLAIGLLVPISGGLNTGQYAVIQMTKWGSAFASKTWTGFLGGLTTNFNSMGFVVPPPPYVESVVKNIIAYGGCVAQHNAMIKAMIASGATDLDGYLIPNIEFRPYESEGGLFAESNYVEAAFLSTNKKVGCGSIRLPPEPDYVSGDPLDGLAAGVYKVSYDTFTNVVDIVTQPDTAIAKLAVGLLPAAYRGTVVESTPEGIITESKNLIKTAETSVTTGLHSALSASIAKPFDNAAIAKYSTSGWVMAGAWFNTLARMQGGLFDMVNSTFSVELSPPQLSSGGFSGWVSQKTGLFDSGKIRTNDQTVSEYVTKFASIVDSANKNDVTALAATGSSADSNPALGTVSSLFFKGLDFAGRQIELWDKNGIILQAGNNANPFSEVASFGYKLFSYAMNLMTVAGMGTMASAATGAVLGSVAAGGVSGGLALPAGGIAGAFIGAGIANIAGGLLGVAFTIAGAMAAAGIMMGFYVPLLPFIRFFFHVLSWLISVFEAVVSAPLFALAHLTPYGDGLPGGVAQKGYFFILSIFLRPVLTVFGLIAGMLMFFVAINFLNLSFSVASASVGAFEGGFAVLSKIIFCLMYCVLVYICANNCFKTVGYFAEHGMNWMNAQGSMGVGMGDRGMVEKVMGAGTAYLGHKTGEMVQSASKAGGQAIGDPMAKKIGHASSHNLKNKDDAILAEKEHAAGEVAEQRHGEIRDAITNLGQNNSLNGPSGSGGSALGGGQNNPPIGPRGSGGGGSGGNLGGGGNLAGGQGSPSIGRTSPSGGGRSDGDVKRLVTDKDGGDDRK